VSEASLALAALLFVLLLALYLNKLIRYRSAVEKELAHPIQINFFPTISISLILLGIATLEPWPAAAQWLWAAGTGLHLLFSLYVMGFWIHHDQFEIHHINPAWFLPVVGNALVPIAGVPLGYPELSWFFFSIGMLFWLILFAIIMYRVLFHNPLPERLMPTFFILIAPPAVGFVAYVQLAGSLDACARILYYGGLFLSLLLVTQIGRFVRIQFYLSWWAYSFPLAAITVATLIMYEQTGLVAFAVIGWVLLSFVTLVVVYLLYRTAQAASGGKICIPAV
jgi:tellurite resistance protein